MRLMTIELSGFKGANQSIEIEPLTILTGPNGSGKSRLLQGVRYALSGDVASGKTLEAAADYFSPAGGAVSVTDDEGVRVRRSLHCGDGTRRSTISMSTAARADAKTIESAIAGRYGSFSPMFDLGEFTGLSAEGRREFISRLTSRYAVRPDGWSAAAAVRAAWHRAANPSEIEDKIAQAHLDEAGVLANRKCDAATELANFMAELKDVVNMSKRQCERSRSAVLALEKSRGALPKAICRTADIESDLAQLMIQRDELLAQLHVQEGRESALRSLDARISAAGENIERLEKTFSQRSESAVDPAAIAASKKRVDEMNPGQIAAPAPNTTDLYDRLTSRRSALLAAEGRVRTALAAQTSMAERMNALRAEMANAKKNPWRMAEELVQSIRELLQDNDYVSRLMELVRDQLDTRPLAAIEADIESAAIHSSRLDEEYVVMTGELDAATLAAGEADREYSSAVERLAADSAARQRYADACAEHQQMVDMAARVQAELDSLTASIIVARGDLLCGEEARQRLIEEHGLVKDELIREQIDAVEARKIALEEQIAAARKSEIIDVQLADMVVSANADRMRNEVAKELLDAAKTVRETMMADLLRPLTDKIDLFLSSCGIDARVFVGTETATGKAALVLGLSRSGEEIPLETLSGGESCLFVAALAYALVEVADPPLKLLLLEASEMDRDALRAMMIGLSQLRHTVSNVLIAAHHYHACDDDGWRVIDMGAQP